MDTLVPSPPSSRRGTLRGLVEDRKPHRDHGQDSQAAASRDAQALLAGSVPPNVLERGYLHAAWSATVNVGLPFSHLTRVATTFACSASLVQVHLGFVQSPQTSCFRSLPSASF